MVKKKLIVTVLGTLGTVIFLAGLFTPLELGAPHYAFFWALACWVITGAIQGFVKEEKKGEEGR
jgi:urea transporter